MGIMNSIFLQSVPEFHKSERVPLIRAKKLIFVTIVSILILFPLLCTIGQMVHVSPFKDVRPQLSTTEFVKTPPTNTGGILNLSGEDSTEDQRVVVVGAVPDELSAKIAGGADGEPEVSTPQPAEAAVQGGAVPPSEATITPSSNSNELQAAIVGESEATHASHADDYPQPLQAIITTESEKQHAEHTPQPLEGGIIAEFDTTHASHIGEYPEPLQGGINSGETEQQHSAHDSLDLDHVPPAVPVDASISHQPKASTSTTTPMTTEQSAKDNDVAADTKKDTEQSAPSSVSPSSSSSSSSSTNEVLKKLKDRRRPSADSSVKSASPDSVKESPVGQVSTDATTPESLTARVDGGAVGGEMLSAAVVSAGLDATIQGGAPTKVLAETVENVVDPTLTAPTPAAKDATTPTIESPKLLTFNEIQRDAAAINQVMGETFKKALTTKKSSPALTTVKALNSLPGRASKVVSPHSGSSVSPNSTPSKAAPTVRPLSVNRGSTNRDHSIPLPSKSNVKPPTRGSAVQERSQNVRSSAVPAKLPTKARVAPVKSTAKPVAVKKNTNSTVKSPKPTVMPLAKKNAPTKPSSSSPSKATAAPSKPAPKTASSLAAPSKAKSPTSPHSTPKKAPIVQSTVNSPIAKVDNKPPPQKMLAPPKI